MSEIIRETFIVISRIITILPLVLFLMLFMGKRTVGELQVFDFIIMITIGSITGADLANPEIKQYPTVIALICITLLHRIVINLKISNRKIGHLITFEPTVVIQNGQFIYKNLKKVKYSIDNVLTMLREKDIFDINDVETAIVESTGAISVLKKIEKHYVTIEDLSIKRNSTSIAFPVIIEGSIYPDILTHLGTTEAWLNNELSKKDIKDIKDVFFASLNNKLELHISFKHDNTIIVPPIKH